MESGFWNPLSVFGIPHQTGNLASSCKIPLRIWHPMQKFYSHIQASLLLWHPYVRVQYNNHLKQLLQFYHSSSAGNCSRPAHLKWNQFCHTWPYHHMFLASDKQQFNLHTGEVGPVMGASLSLWKRHHCFPLKTSQHVLSRLGKVEVQSCYIITWCGPSHFRCGWFLGAEWKLHYITLTLQVTLRYQQTSDLWNAIRSKNKGPI